MARIWARKPALDNLSSFRHFYVLADEVFAKVDFIDSKFLNRRKLSFCDFYFIKVEHENRRS